MRVYIINTVSRIRNASSGTRKPPGLRWAMVGTAAVMWAKAIKRKIKDKVPFIVEVVVEYSWGVECSIDPGCLHLYC